MADMLVRLYDLPDLAPAIAEQRARGIEIRRGLAPDKRSVLEWVTKHWGDGWASECDVSFARQPVACILARQGEQIVGFACYESTCRNFFGPTGVRKSARGSGVGRALLLACLHAMRAEGYGYAILGGVGPDVARFYAKTVGAVAIEGSDPGVYGGAL
jgi:GNAT superfamily N-acetyltransferase